MSLKLTSVEPCEAELSENERDLKDLTWGQFMATLARAGSEMGDFNDRLQRLQEANNAIFAAALSTGVFNDVSLSVCPSTF